MPQRDYNGNWVALLPRPRLALVLAGAAARCARMRSSSTLAGSSFGSRGANYPVNAFRRMDYRDRTRPHGGPANHLDSVARP